MRKTRYNLYEVLLIEQHAHKDYMFLYYMDDEKHYTANPVLRFNAASLQHAKTLIAKTKYEGNIKCILNNA